LIGRNPFSSARAMEVTMNCKSIIAVAAGEDEDAAVFAAAAGLAARFGAQLQVVPAFPDPAADLVYYGASLKRASKDAAVERVTVSERDAQEKIESLARHAGVQAGLGEGALTVEKRELQPALALAPASVLADLVLFGGGAAAGALSGLFAETLISSRAPCLLIKDSAYVFGPAAIAWDGSAQAARAVRAALPLLGVASEVVVLRNSDDAGADDEAADMQRLISYLERHGLKASARRVQGEKVATSLLEAARAGKCELLIAGAFGRPRLYELVLGGTTRALTQATGAPHVLLAH
jgi:nucleotide-binding universal stress UspA family protein